MTRVPRVPPGRPKPWLAGEVAVYHITHIRNIGGMAADGYLRCDRVCRAKRLDPVSIAYEDLKERRSRWPVTLARGGTLSDYVPFYYAPRSPMLYVISRGGVAGYAGGQVEVAHLVLSLKEIARPGDFVITDGHAATPLTQPYDELKHLDKIDWPVMAGTYWHDTDEAGDRKRRRQAEFLVADSVPFSAVKQIGVMNQAVADDVRRAIQGAKHQPLVAVRRDWYY